MRSENCDYMVTRPDGNSYVRILSHVCLIHCFLGEGQLFSFGWNAFGQCGTGDREDRAKPFQITALPNTRVVDVAAGEVHSLCVTGLTLHTSCISTHLVTFAVVVVDCGEVWGWGSNMYGQLGLEEDVALLEEYERPDSPPDGERKKSIEENLMHLSPCLLTSLRGEIVQQVVCHWSHSAVITGICISSL